MATALLKTKLHIPPLRPDLVPRPRIVQRLRDALVRPLTLVCAPAGFGKTTLIIQWLHTKDKSGRQQDEGLSASSIPHPSQVAWLSLDENDNDPTRFFTYLVAALHNINLPISVALQRMIQAPQPPPSEVLLTDLVNDIAAVPHEFFLILDDYHLIHSLAIHQQIAFLLEHQPPLMHVVILSREDPPLPLARLRAQGQVADIRQDDLRFTEEETANLIRQVTQVNLSRDDIAALHRRTEGWITGLQLAGLSLRGCNDVSRFIQLFTGSNRFVLDYLMEEVFARQSVAVQEFLLTTSILERMCGALCDRLFSESDSGLPIAEGASKDSQQTLEHLERSNLFVVPLDDERHWYRYHHLFADLLRHRLKLDSRYEVTQLHQRASAWYAEQGFMSDAIHHALAARDWTLAATLILGECESMLRRGEIVTMLKWLQALPDAIVRSNLELCLNFSWALILTGQLDAAEAYLKQTKAVAQDITPLLSNILAAQAHIARARGDDRRSIELSQKALALMPADALMERSVFALNLGIACLNSGRLTEAEQSLTEAEQMAQTVGNHYVRLIALTCLGAIQIVRGRLHRGEEFFQQAIRAGDESPAVALAHLHYGALLYEWNDLATAAEHLLAGLEQSQRGGNPEVQIGAYRTLAMLKQAQGDASAARAAIEQAHQFAHDHNLPLVMHAAIAATHVQLALAENDLSTAVRWADQVTQNADASPFYPTLGLTRARVLIAQKHNSMAMAELTKCFASIECVGWVGGLIAARVLQSLVAETSQARLEFLTDALTRAQPEGYIRTFADAGEALLPLLQDVAQQGTFPEYVGKIMAAIKRKPSVLAQSLVEPLSERELEVLRLMAAGLSNRAIAKKLVISLGTAKTHIHNIFGKLDAQNRVQAIARARKAGIV